MTIFLPALQQIHSGVKFSDTADGTARPTGDGASPASALSTKAWAESGDHAADRGKGREGGAPWHGGGRGGECRTVRSSQHAAQVLTRCFGSAIQYRAQAKGNARATPLKAMRAPRQHALPHPCTVGRRGRCLPRAIGSGDQALPPRVGLGPQRPNRLRNKGGEADLLRRCGCPRRRGWRRGRGEKRPCQR